MAPLRESEDDAVMAHRRSPHRPSGSGDEQQLELSLRVAPSADDQQQHQPLQDAGDEEAKRMRATRGSAPSKILFLDGLRGVAAVLVVTQHVGYMGDINLGECAVDIFFVLSSFLLTWLFYKKSEQLLAQKASYRKWFFMLVDYFSKRFFRVYPLFAIVATVVWMLPNESKQRYFHVQKPEEYDLYKVLTFEFEHRYHVFWTLPLEIAYYFLIPLIVLIAIRLGQGWWVPCGPLFYWIGIEGWTELRGDHQPLRPHLSTFVCGSLAAILYVKIDAAIKRYPGFEFTKWQVFALRAVEFITFWLLLSVFYRSLVFDWFIEHPRQNKYYARFISGHLTILIIIEMLLPSALSTALEWNVLRHWGKIGFSVYLLHSFVMSYEPIGSQENYYDKLISVFFLIHVVSTISFHLIEQPCQRMSLQISKNLTNMASGGGGSKFAYRPVALQEGSSSSVTRHEGSLLPVAMNK